VAVERHDPYRSFNFRVAIGARSRATDGYSEVRLPVMAIGEDVPESLATQRHLVLRRGYTGAADLREWWDRERLAPGQGRGRVVVVELLDETRGDPVTAWRFTGCRPVALHYSSLDALDSAVLVETIALAFEDVAIS
jgi:phage tail-like protein